MHFGDGCSFCRIRRQSNERYEEGLYFYKRAYEDNSQSPMWSYMHEYFVRQYSEIARLKCATELDAQTLFSIRLYCYGTLGMTREWLLKDNITPADAVVRMMFASMPEHLKALFFDL